MQTLVNAWPEAVHQHDRNGKSPMHTLCENSELDDMASVNILNILINIDSASLRNEDAYDDALPIHFAASNKSLEFCKKLIDAYPESLMMGTNYGHLPIHSACCGGRVETVEYILKLSPKSIDTSDWRGHYPIHLAASHCASWAANSEIIKLLLTHDPASAAKAIPDTDRVLPHCLPLHVVAGIGCGRLSSVQLIFDAYPEAICTTDGHGETPLMIAARWVSVEHQRDGCSLDVVNFLKTQLDYAWISQDMVAMTTVGYNGWLPLHRALHKNASLGAIKLLVKGNPSAVQVVDHNLSLPLHIACEFSSADVVQFLVQFNDISLYQLDVNKDSPLHYACRGGKHNVVKYLLDRSPLSVSERNSSKKLPIHLFCLSGRSKVGCESSAYIETLWRLLLAYPETVKNL